MNVVSLGRCGPPPISQSCILVRAPRKKRAMPLQARVISADPHGLLAQRSHDASFHGSARDALPSLNRQGTSCKRKCHDPRGGISPRHTTHAFGNCRLGALQFFARITAQPVSARRQLLPEEGPAYGRCPFGILDGLGKKVIEACSSSTLAMKSVIADAHPSETTGKHTRVDRRTRRRSSATCKSVLEQQDSGSQRPTSLANDSRALIAAAQPSSSRRTFASAIRVPPSRSPGTIYRTDEERGVAAPKRLPL